jgi:hypothetical protein
MSIEPSLSTKMTFSRAVPRANAEVSLDVAPNTSTARAETAHVKKLPSTKKIIAERWYIISIKLPPRNSVKSRGRNQELADVM